MCVYSLSEVDDARHSAAIARYLKKKVVQKHQKTSHIDRTCVYHVARGVHFANEKLQSDDGVDDDDEEDQQSDVKQGNHGFNNGV